LQRWIDGRTDSVVPWREDDDNKTQRTSYRPINEYECEESEDKRSNFVVVDEPPARKWE